MNTLEIKYRWDAETVTKCVDPEYPICYSGQMYNVGFKKDFTDPTGKSLIFRFEKRTGVLKQPTATRSLTTTHYLCNCVVNTGDSPTIACIAIKNQKNGKEAPTQTALPIQSIIEYMFHSLTGAILQELQREKPENTQSFHTIKEMKAALIKLLCTIVDYKNLLPYPVHIEEIGTQNNLIYKQYDLLQIHPDGSCQVQKTLTDQPQKRHLSELYPEHLLRLWKSYTALNKSGVSLPAISQSTGDLEPEFRFKQENERSAFIWHMDHLQQNSTDQEIIQAYEEDNNTDHSVQKLTLDEFAAKLNSEQYNDLEYYVRFIKY